MIEYIKRKEAVELLERAFDNNWEVSGTLDRLRAIHAADVKPVKRGKWVKQEPYDVWKCSACKEDNLYAYSCDEEGYKLQDLFCPHCGADMRKE